MNIVMIKWPVCRTVTVPGIQEDKSALESNIVMALIVLEMDVFGHIGLTSAHQIWTKSKNDSQAGVWGSVLLGVLIGSEVTLNQNPWWEHHGQFFDLSVGAFRTNYASLGGHFCTPINT